jgi:hypothetical protein
MRSVISKRLLRAPRRNVRARCEPAGMSKHAALLALTHNRGELDAAVLARLLAVSKS